MSDRDFMQRALSLAHSAKELGEVPVGAVVVKDGEIIAEGHNLRQTGGLATAHAEIIAIEAACRAIGSWRLSGCTLYVTLEPCPMCAGALVNSRIDRVVYGVEDAKAGCLGSVINFNSYPFNHAFEVQGGVLREECAAILAEFFSDKRKIQNK